MLAGEGTPAFGERLKEEPQIHGVERAGVIPAGDRRIEVIVVKRGVRAARGVCLGQDADGILDADDGGLLFHLRHAVKLRRAQRQKFVCVLAEQLDRQRAELLHRGDVRDGRELRGRMAEHDRHHPAFVFAEKVERDADAEFVVNDGAPEALICDGLIAYVLGVQRSRLRKRLNAQEVKELYALFLRRAEVAPAFPGTRPPG